MDTLVQRIVTTKAWYLAWVVCRNSARKVPISSWFNNAFIALRFTLDFSFRFLTTFIKLPHIPFLYSHCIIPIVSISSAIKIMWHTSILKKNQETLFVYMVFWVIFYRHVKGRYALIGVAQFSLKFKCHITAYFSPLDPIWLILHIKSVWINGMCIQNMTFSSRAYNVNDWFHSDCIQLLLAHGAPVRVKNLQGWTPLAEAISFGSRQTSKLYLTSR